MTPFHHIYYTQREAANLGISAILRYISTYIFFEIIFTWCYIKRRKKVKKKIKEKKSKSWYKSHKDKNALVRRIYSLVNLISFSFLHPSFLHRTFLFIYLFNHAYRLPCVTTQKRSEKMCCSRT